MDPDGSKARERAEVERRLKIAAQEPQEALARAFESEGFAEARAMATALWSLAQRSRQTWAGGDKKSGAGPGALSWSVEESARSPMAAFARLCLRVKKAAAFSEPLENPLRPYLRPAEARIDLEALRGKTPAQLAQVFMSSVSKGVWEAARLVVDCPGFDWFGMTRANARGYAWEGMIPGKIEAPLDGSMSPIQCLVGQFVKIGALQGPGVANSAPISTNAFLSINAFAPAQAREMIAMVWSVAQAETLRAELAKMKAPAAIEAAEANKSAVVPEPKRNARRI